jgi:hypothetical protein
VHAIDDEPFDAAAVEAGAWPSPYGDGDTLGTYVEVTPRKSAAALRSLAASEATGVRTFNLGETLFDGYPAFGTRTYSLAVRGSGFASSAHAETARSRPWGPNRLTSLEERVEFSFNLGAKINGLAHCGVGDRLYAGRSLAAYVADGSRQLDTTTFGSPLVTRGLLFDVLGFYVAHDRDDALSHTVDGEAIVRDDHRITVEDLEACAAWAGLGEVEPGAPDGAACCAAIRSGTCGPTRACSFARRVGSHSSGPLSWGPTRGASRRSTQRSPVRS